MVAARREVDDRRLGIDALAVDPSNDADGGDGTSISSPTFDAKVETSEVCHRCSPCTRVGCSGPMKFWLVGPVFKIECRPRGSGAASRRS